MGTEKEKIQITVFLVVAEYEDTLIPEIAFHNEDEAWRYIEVVSDPFDETHSYDVQKIELLNNYY